MKKPQAPLAHLGRHRDSQREQLVGLVDGAERPVPLVAAGEGAPEVP